MDKIYQVSESKRSNTAFASSTSFCAFFLM